MVQYFPVITGSLTVTGSVFVSGSITATGGVTISGSIDSASYAANAERLDNLDSTSFVFTSSYNQDSSSLSGRVTTIESKYATTGSNIFTQNQTICGNLTTTGTITAQTINVQQVTSSIVYSSGSNIFGNLTTDVQQMTGSLRITGSGNHWFQTGCVGIGTILPCQKLHVFGQSDATKARFELFGVGGINEVLQVSNTANWSTNRGVKIGLYVNSGSNQSQIGAEIGAVTNGADQFGADLFFNVASSSAATERMRITTAGNVGINNASPNASWGATISNPTTYSSNALRLERNGIATQGLNISAGGEVVTFEGFNTAVGGLNSAFVWTSTANTTTTERMRITSGGNVGIGATNPLQKLTVIGGISGSLLAQESTAKFVNTGSLYTKVTLSDNVNYDGVISMENNATKANNKLRIYIGNATTELNNHITLTGNGNVGIGTCNPGQLLTLGGTTTPQLSIVSNTTTGGSEIYFGDSDAVYRGFIGYYHNGDYMTFNTAAAERMRITSGGCVQINTTCTATGILHVGAPATSVMATFRSSNSTGTDISFISSQITGQIDNYSVSHIICHGSAGGYQISTNADTRWIRIIAGSNGVQLCGTGTSWFSLSDERRKLIYNTIDNGVDVINKWKPIIYRFCTDVDTVRRSGLTAQSVLQTRPEAVSYDEHEDVYRIGYTELIPDLVSAIQQQTCIICTLKTCLGIM
jgi:hypothetical protein